MITTLRSMFCLRLFFLIPMFLFAQVGSGVHAAALLTSDLRGESVSLLPYLEYAVDERGTMDIETLTKQGQGLEFRPVRPLDLDMKPGVFWLRFTLAPLPEGAKQLEWLLFLGESIPGNPTLYIPEQSEAGRLQWKTLQSTDYRHIVNLPEAGPEARTCYIRLAGPPGLWFAPMLRSPQNAANNWGTLAHPAAVLGLFVILLLCVLRCFSERGQWRIWTVLFVGGALASAYLGLPTLEQGHIRLDQFVSTLAPGATLMFLPHVARHMMRTSRLSRIVDAQLILLTLIGAAVTLLPLVPGFGQTARFLEIWPLCMIFFIPTALWALFIGLPCSQRFLLLCIFPPLFTAAGILGLFSGLPADSLSAFPLFGVALSALMLVAAPNPPLPAEEANVPEPLTLSGTNEEPGDLNHLSLEAPQKSPKKGKESRESKEKQDTALEQFANSFQPARQAAANRPGVPLEIVPKILELVSSLELSKVPTHLRARIVALREQAERVSDALCGTTYMKEYMEEEQNAPIDLQGLMRSMYACAVQESKNTNIALAWYMPPELPTLYTGNGARIKTVLLQLVESAVAATSRGSVHFTVRHYPSSADPGHLLFTITDTGDFTASDKRSGGAVANAWDLAAAYRGAVTILSDAQGTTISLALHLGFPEGIGEPAQKKVPLILICSENPSLRLRIRTLLENFSCRLEEAASLTEAQKIHENYPALLFIVHDTLATAKAGLLIRTMRKQASDAGLPFCRILAITRTKVEWKQLAKAGFTHALLEPLDEEALLATVTDLLDDYEAASGVDDTGAVVEEEKPLPDIFGKGAGNVPKDIDELIDIARVLNSFSSLGNISKQVSARSRQARQKNMGAAPRSDQTKKGLVGVSDARSGSMGVTRDPDEDKLLAHLQDAQKAQERTTATTAQEKEPLTDYHSAPRSANSEWGKDAGSQTGREQGGTWFSEDEWVGEPFPVASKPRETERSDGEDKGALDGRQREKIKNFPKEIRVEQKATRVAWNQQAANDTPRKSLAQIEEERIVQELIARLNKALSDAKNALEVGQSMRVAEAANRIAAECDAFGFRILARVARCVENAGKAGDLAALRDLLPELEHQVERNNIALAEGNS